MKKSGLDRKRRQSPPLLDCFLPWRQAHFDNVLERVGEGP
jgi:hypothetical protein